MYKRYGMRIDVKDELRARIIMESGIGLSIR
jgi:hypothetical protein